MALGITSLKKGAVFAIDGVPYRVVEYSQKVMGRGGSTVNVKIKSLIDGKVLSKTFHGNDQVDEAGITHKNVQYLYCDDSKYYLMDNESFEQHEMSLGHDESLKNFLTDGDNVRAQFFEGNLIGVEMPKNVKLEVVYTEDAVRGDTSSAITKDAELETGLKVKVPAFIKTGDFVSIDTSTGAYRERLK